MADPRKPDEDRPPRPAATDGRAPEETEPGFDPFATFTEWASAEDTAGYADL